MTIWEKIFGTNWRTSLSACVAFIFFAASYIITNRASFLALEFLSPGVKSFVISLCSFIGFAGAIMFAYHTKDALSTGTNEHSLMLGVHKNRKVTTEVKVMQWALIALVFYLIFVSTFLVHRSLFH